MDEPSTYTINILNKSFQVACSGQEKRELVEAADFLDKKMKEYQRSGSIVGLEKIAIMTALNISHELLSLKRQVHELKHQEKDFGAVDKQIQFLQNKVKDAIEKNNAILG